MTGMYDGVDLPAPARCLGCADGIVVLDHQCARNRQLAPGGGYCACTRPGCGPAPTAARRPQQVAPAR